MEEIIIDKTKDIQGMDEFAFYGYFYKCTQCSENIISSYDYCPNCGSKIKWVDEKNNT